MFGVTNNKNSMENESRPADERKSANVAKQTGTAETEPQNESTVSTSTSERATSSANATQKSSDSDLPGAQSETGKSEERDMDQQQSKTISHQDIHSEYTKPRYKHVSSKAGQLIEQLHSTLDDQERDTYYNCIENLLNKNDRLQGYKEHLERKLKDKMRETIELKRIEEHFRIELAQCHDDLKRRQMLNLTMLQQSSLHSTHNREIKTITKATQTDTNFLSQSATQATSRKLTDCFVPEPTITGNSNANDDTNTSYSDALTSAYAWGPKNKLSLLTRLLCIFIPCVRCNEAVWSDDESAGSVGPVSDQNW